MKSVEVRYRAEMMADRHLIHHDTRQWYRWESQIDCVHKTLRRACGEEQVETKLTGDDIDRLETVEPTVSLAKEFSLCG